MSTARLVLLLAIVPALSAQSDDTPAATPAPPPENAQVKAIREQLEREAAARQAVIDADIAKNPNGRNAQEARKAAEAKKAAAAAQQALEDKAKADADAAATASAEQAEKDRKAAEAAWKAGAAERARAEAKKQAAIDNWRKSSKPGHSVMMSRKSDGSFAVMVDGKISTFANEADAKAFVDKVQNSSDSTLSY